MFSQKSIFRNKKVKVKLTFTFLVIKRIFVCRFLQVVYSVARVAPHNGAIAAVPTRVPTARFARCFTVDSKVITR